MRCPQHRHAFTVYPPGYAPYARQPLLEATPDGTLAGGDDTLAEQALDATLFAAAKDGADGVAWRPTGAAFTTGRWRTQQRHIERAIRLFGLDSGSQMLDKVAHLLAVPAMDLRRTAAALRVVRPGYRQRGAAVMETLGLLPVRPALADDLLRCGAATGLWPQPVFYR